MLLRKMILMGPEEGATPSPSGGSGDATASTPASSSAAPAASSAPSTASGDQPGTIEEFNFASLTHDDEPAAPKAEPVAQTPPPAAAAQPAPPAATTAPQTPAPAAAAPPSNVEQPQTPPAAATTTEPASEAPAPQQIDWQAHRAQFLPKIQEMYKLSDEEVQEFQTNPGVALPKLAAELHYKVMMASHAAMTEILPAMIANQMQNQRLASEHETAFYGQWPDLKKAVEKDIKVEATINEAIRAYKTANPKAPVKEVMQKAGLLAMISLGINPTAPQAQAPTPVPATVVPPVIPGRPAGVGASQVAPTPAQGAPASEAEFFGDLANHFASGNY